MLPQTKEYFREKKKIRIVAKREDRRIFLEVHGVNRAGREVAQTPKQDMMDKPDATISCHLSKQ